MIAPGDFVQRLVDAGITRFTGVPCSFFQAAINRILDDRRLSYTIAPNEGSALALASGAALAGSPTAVLIQNSGFGNLINPLTSLNMIYRIPVLIFMSGRAYGVPDEPQHEIMGKSMVPLLDAMGVPHEDMPAEAEAFGAALRAALERMKATGLPYVFLVRKGSIDEYVAGKKPSAARPLSRIEAIRIVSDKAGPETFVVATTGKPSRELFAIDDRPRNFYMQGSMGHAASIALGVALNRPGRRVVALDGDGAVIMHLGVLSTIGHYKPANLVHVVLDNESYETTGDQDTTSSTTDLAAAARAAGYRTAEEAADTASLEAALSRLLAAEGPSFLRVRINRVPAAGIPRISERHSSQQIAGNFSAALRSRP